MPYRRGNWGSIDVLPHGHFIIVETVSVAQFAQIFPRLQILNGICARSYEIVVGNRVLHPPQIEIDPIPRFLYHGEQSSVGRTRNLRSRRLTPSREPVDPVD